MSEPTVHKYELELTTQQAKALVLVFRGHPDFGTTFAEQFANEIPVPAPTYVGAMVRTDQGTYLRWAYDSHTHEPWVATNNVDNTYSTEDIGRIRDVLSQGRIL